MEVNLGVHVVAGLKVFFDGLDAVGGHDDILLAFVESEDVEQAFEVVDAVLYSGHNAVAEKVVEAVGVELGRDDLGEERGTGFFLDDIYDFIGEGSVVATEDLIDPAGGFEDDALGPGFVVDAHETFKEVAEGTVADVMEEGGAAGGEAHVGWNGMFASELIEDAGGDMHGSDGMTEPGVFGTVIGEICETHLSNVAETLHFGGINELHEGHVFGRVFIQSYQVMDGVTVKLVSDQEGPRGRVGVL